MQERQTKQRTITTVPTPQLEAGDNVYARNYRGDKWFPAIVTKKTGPLSYEVREEGEGIQRGIHRRHVDQIQSGLQRSEEIVRDVTDVMSTPEVSSSDDLPDNLPVLERRQVRQRHQPSYLKDYVTS